MPYPKGRTNNPNGRPPKNRALTDLLEAAGEVAIKGKKQTRAQFLSDRLWEIITEGTATLANGKVMQVAPSDWLGVVQFLYKQIDGPPPQTVEMNMDDAANIIRVVTHGKAQTGNTNG